MDDFEKDIDSMRDVYMTDTQRKAYDRIVVLAKMAMQQLHEENPPELLASKLIDTWCNVHNQQMPWAKAVDIVAIITKMPESERLRLLAL